MVKNKIPENKYEFGAFAINHCFKIISIIIAAGLTIFLLQIKSFQCGDAKIEKQPLKTQFKK